MADTELYRDILKDVKNALGITTNFQDKTIQQYIDEVKGFLVDSGVPILVVNSIKAKGIIARGVADLWNYGSGGTSLSPYFMQRATQFALVSDAEDTEDYGMEEITDEEIEILFNEDARELLPDGDEEPEDGVYEEISEEDINNLFDRDSEGNTKEEISEEEINDLFKN